MSSRRARSWIALVVLTGTVTSLMRLAHLPGALMLGPMVSGIVVAISLPGAKLPGLSTLGAQSVLGCLIASTLSPPLIALFLSHWLLIVGMNLTLIFALFLLGLAATCLGWFPGTAGIWGMSPGGASAMVMLSDAYGSDKRIVALMHYLRLIWAVLAVIAMGILLGAPRTSDPGFILPGVSGAAWFPAVEIQAIGAMVILVGIGVSAAALLRTAPLAILLPMFCGIALQATGLVHLQLPPIISAIAFGIIGWHVGLSFSRKSLVHSARLIPRIMMTIVIILGVCVALASILMLVAHVDFLTAYMALNPGGVDVVLLTAASVEVDLPIIIAMQISRLILVIAIAPVLARIAANWHQKTIRSEFKPPHST
tara:strand:+ start:9008 stop:10111 length:1104 start_codon:yes stop_codon:yes gene_type:complete